MTWVRIDDGFAEHPKIVALSDAAFRLHVSALCYAARALTDGIVPRAALGRLGGSPKLAAELVRSGVWDEDDGAGWRIHDWSDWQPTGPEVEARKAAARDRARRSREARAAHVQRTRDAPQARAPGARAAHVQRTDDALPADETRTPPRARDARDPCAGAPARDPVPVPDLASQDLMGAADAAPPAKPRKRGSACPESTDPSATAWCASQGLPGPSDARVAAMLDHHHAKGSVMRSWAAAWRTWQRNEARFTGRARPAAAPPTEHASRSTKYDYFDDPLQPTPEASA